MAEPLVRHHDDRGVYTITMDRGPNALDMDLMTELRQHLERLVSAGAPPLVFASSHPRLFSPGWDLKELVEADRARVAAVLDVFDRLILDLFRYPGPTAAAVAGHAVAGGCLLAIACDVRVMKSGMPRLGLAELNLGIPVPAGSVRMLAARLTPTAVEELVLRGDGFSAAKALQLGLVQRNTADDDVLPAAEAELRRLAAKSPHAFAATKRYMYGDVWRWMDEAREAEQQSFLDCWFEDATRERISEVVRSLGHQ
jgi:enoyl-CoA hydratase